MKSLFFQSQTGYKVSFESADISPGETPDEYLIGAYLPGITLTKDNTNVGLSIRFEESPVKQLVRMGDVLIIKDTWNNKFSLDLWHLLYSVFRLDYIKHGFFPVHASCVGKEKMALLVAHSGMGKTTLALRLMNDLDWQIFSGNKTFIDFSRGFHAIAGTKTVSIRSEDFNKYPNLVDDSSAFSDRIAFDLPARHISSSASVPISAIFIVKIDDGQDGIEEIISPSNLHLLYPFFLDTVYADTVLCGGEAVFSGNIDDSSKSRLSAFLRSALNKVKVYNLKGSVSFMADQVKNLT